MTAVTRPQGPLPARVYWTRRVLVLVVALALVFGVAHLLGRGGSPSGGPSAQPVGANQTSAGTAPVTPTVPLTQQPTSQSSDLPGDLPTDLPSDQPTGGVGVTQAPTATGQGGSPAATPSTPLAQPTGSCASSDVVAVPSVEGTAYAGKPVVLTLTLTTRTSPACTWEVSASSLVLKITSGPDRIWSTQDCTGAVPKQVVVVRKEAPTTVSVVWNGLRSDAECSRATEWAEPGYYHAVAAAFGADPTDAQFRLAKPQRTTETASPTPSPTPSAKPSGKSSGEPSGKPSAKPSAKASAKQSAGPSAGPSGSRQPSPSASSRPRPSP